VEIFVPNTEITQRKKVTGKTKFRTEIAAQMMLAFKPSRGFSPHEYNGHYQFLAKAALRLADAVIAEVEKSENILKSDPKDRGNGSHEFGRKPTRG
jgi:hypothetical protein